MDQDCAESAVGRDKLGALLPKKDANSQRHRHAQPDKLWQSGCLIAIMSKVRKTQPAKLLAFRRQDIPVYCALPLVKESTVLLRGAWLRGPF